MKSWIITITNDFGVVNWRDVSLDHALKVIAAHKEIYSQNKIKLSYKSI